MIARFARNNPWQRIFKPQRQKTGQDIANLNPHRGTPKCNQVRYELSEVLLHYL